MQIYFHSTGFIQNGSTDTTIRMPPSPPHHAATGSPDRAALIAELAATSLPDVVAGDASTQGSSSSRISLCCCENVTLDEVKEVLMEDGEGEVPPDGRFGPFRLDLTPPRRPGAAGPRWGGLRARHRSRHRPRRRRRRRPRRRDRGSGPHRARWSKPRTSQAYPAWRTPPPSYE